MLSLGPYPFALPSSSWPLPGSVSSSLDSGITPGPDLLVPMCFSYFPWCCDKILDKNYLRKKGLIVHSVKVQSVHHDKRDMEAGVIRHTAPTVKSDEWLCPFYSGWHSNPWDDPPTFRVLLLSSCKPFGNTTVVTHSSASLSDLKPIKLTWRLTSHIKSSKK